MKTKSVKKVWGREEWIVNNDKYCFKELHIKENAQCSLHYHKDKDETFILRHGRVILYNNGNTFIMKVNDTVRVLPHQRHQFYGLEDSMLYEVSTHHEDSDSYRLTESTPGEDIICQ